jgi:preprotein translocase subunit SecE
MCVLAYFVGALYSFNQSIAKICGLLVLLMAVLSSGFIAGFDMVLA